MKSNFRVLGAGIWGLAFSDYLIHLGHNVDVFCRDTDLSNKNLKGINLHSLSSRNIKPLDALNEYNASDAINIMAVNSKGFDSVLTKYQDYFKGIKELVSLTKGIDHGCGLLFHSLIKERISTDVKYGLISGPSFAKDLVDRKKIAVSFACHDDNLIMNMSKATKSSFFEIIPITDIYHIEIAGIIKNIAAILCGMSDSFFGKEKYTNIIIKKASDEIWKMSYKALSDEKEEYDFPKNLDNYLSENKERIVTSPGFIGDMILTCKQETSRNYQFGKLISDADTTIRDAKNYIGTVEGYDCCITLIEKSSYAVGNITKLLYEIINCANTRREDILSNFLQA